MAFTQYQMLGMVMTRTATLLEKLKILQSLRHVEQAIESLRSLDIESKEPNICMMILYSEATEKKHHGKKCFKMDFWNLTHIQRWIILNPWEMVKFVMKTGESHVLLPYQSATIRNPLWNRCSEVPRRYMVLILPSRGSSLPSLSAWLWWWAWAKGAQVCWDSRFWNDLEFLLAPYRARDVFCLEFRSAILMVIDVDSSSFQLVCQQMYTWLCIHVENCFE